jgi:hypothetical protein
LLVDLETNNLSTFWYIFWVCLLKNRSWYLPSTLKCFNAFKVLCIVHILLNKQPLLITFVKKQFGCVSKLEYKSFFCLSNVVLGYAICLSYALIQNNNPNIHNSTKFTKTKTPQFHKNINMGQHASFTKT